MLYCGQIGLEGVALDGKRAVALDLGGTRCRVALVRRDGVVERKVEFLTPRAPSDGLSRLAEAVHAVMADAGPDAVCGLGAAVASPVDARTGTLRHPPNLPGWDGVCLKGEWAGGLGLPVYVGNDGNLAALGEHRFGAGRGATDIIYLTLSTGIGGGVITGGRLMEGARGYGGELGHISIDRNGPRCNCGNIGCWEAIASGIAIARRARERLAAGAPSVLRDMTGGALDRVDAALVAQAARNGDAMSVALLEEVARDLAVGIVSLVHVFNPERIIIGGGVGRDWPLLRPVIEPYVRTHAMPVMRERLEIVMSALGGDAGLVGAAARVFDGEDAERGLSVA